MHPMDVLFPLLATTAVASLIIGHITLFRLYRYRTKELTVGLVMSGMKWVRARYYEPEGLPTHRLFVGSWLAFWGSGILMIVAFALFPR